MTSTSEAETRRAGCSNHLTKPFDLDQLTDLVGKYLLRPHRLRQLPSVSHYRRDMV